MENKKSPELNHYDDEIDLFELAEVIWAKKWLIAAFTFVFALFSAIYAYTASPVYQADITIKPPASQDIVWYNKGSFISENLTRYDRKEVFRTLLDYLNSDSLRYEFFQQNYLPRLDAEQLDNSEEALYRGFDEAVSLRRLNAKEFPDDYTLSVKFKDANIAAKLRDELLAKAVNAAKEDLKAAVGGEVRALSNALKLELDGLRRQAEAERLDEIERLTEAFYIAQSIDLDYPAGYTTGKYDTGNKQENTRTPYTEGNPLYLQGGKALEAQTKVLKKRKNNDAHISGLREIESQWQTISDIVIDDSEAKVANYVGETFVPERPVKPRKLLILLIGTILGGAVGCVCILLTHAITERKKQMFEI